MHKTNLLPLLLLEREGMSDQTDTLTGIIVCSTLVKNILFFPCSSRFLDMSEKQTKQNYRTLWVAILYTVTFFFVFFFFQQKTYILRSSSVCARRSAIHSATAHSFPRCNDSVYLVSIRVHVGVSMSAAHPQLALCRAWLVMP